MTIKHFEDASLADIESILNNLSGYTITEKMDGSQLFFGIDDLGFYTSRGRDRIYNVDDYEIEFHTTYRRAAHIALEKSIPKLVAAGMVPGDQVEIEVLYGELPNVVPYSKDINRIIFLRTIEGSFNIDRLQLEFAGYSLPITLLSPITDDGMNIELKDVESTWEFSIVPKFRVNYLKIDVELRSIKEQLDKFLNTSHNDITFREIANCNLNKCPKDRRDHLKEVRKSIRELIQTEYVLPAKEILLDNLVRNRKSEFGPSDGYGWIEGVVLTDSSGNMIKLVDKKIFGVVHRFLWKTRNDLTMLAPILKRREIIDILDKYNNEKNTYSIHIKEIGKTISYNKDIDRRNLEAFASMYKRAI